MKLLLIFFISLTVASHAQTGDKDIAIKFSGTVGSGEKSLVKVEPSGCRTKMSIVDRWNLLSITNDRRCKSEPSKRENAKEIADSIEQMFSVTGIKDSLQSINKVKINIGWRVNHELLLLYINNDDQWPNDIYEYSVKHSPEKSEYYHFYKEKIRQEIIKSQIYKPFISVMGKIGCSMTLAEDFTDGLPFDEKHKNITRDDLIEWSVLKEEEVRKEQYPVIKNGIFFDLNCK